MLLTLYADDIGNVRYFACNGPVLWHKRKKLDKFSVWDKVPQGRILISGDVKFPYNTCNISWGICCARNQLLDRISACDGWT